MDSTEQMTSTPWVCLGDTVDYNYNNSAECTFYDDNNRVQQQYSSTSKYKYTQYSHRRLSSRKVFLKNIFSAITLPIIQTRDVWWLATAPGSVHSVVTFNFILFMLMKLSISITVTCRSSHLSVSLLSLWIGRSHFAPVWICLVSCGHTRRRCLPSENDHI